MNSCLTNSGGTNAPITLAICGGTSALTNRAPLSPISTFEPNFA
jgi:hypothetical protein